MGSCHTEVTLSKSSPGPSGLEQTLGASGDFPWGTGQISRPYSWGFRATFLGQRPEAPPGWAPPCGLWTRVPRVGAEAVLGLAARRPPRAVETVTVRTVGSLLACIISSL